MLSGNSSGLAPSPRKFVPTQSSKSTVWMGASPRCVRAPRRFGSRGAASERKGNNLKRFKIASLKAKARIWP